MGINFKCVIKCALFAVAAGFVLMLALALLSRFTSMPEGAAQTAVYAALALSIFLGSAAAARASEQKAFFHSMLVCLIFAACLVAASYLLNGAVNLGVRFFAVIGGIFAAGFLGCLIAK